MLSESFLQTLSYREKRVPSTAAGRDPRGPPQHGGPAPSGAGERGAHMAQLTTGLNIAELDPDQSLGPSSGSPPKVPFLIPGSSSALVLFPHHLDDHQGACSLIEQYPDLRLRQEPNDGPPGLLSDCSSDCQAVLGLPLQAPQSRPDQNYPAKPGASNPDQGYLEMNRSPAVDLSLFGPEPMSNSLLNGLLERHMDELYRQHFTDSLARCNSQLGNSLLHGLVPPPQPGGQALPSLEGSLETVVSEGEGLKISYLNTATSYFSSPMLRISESESVQ